MNLRQLQHSFSAHLRGADSLPVGATTQGMAVYAHAYRSQLKQCLRETFEKTRLWIGGATFDEAADVYIELHPPRAWTLDAYGDEFATQLDRAWPNDPDVGELAWLDWTLRRAFAALDELPVTMAELAEVDWDEAVFTFASTLRWRHVQSNVAALWRALDDDVLPPDAPAAVVPSALRVWRHGLSTRFASMSATEAACLDMATMGASFGEICAELSRNTDEQTATATAGAMLGNWLSDGMILAIA
jgi:hypothetical protein